MLSRVNQACSGLLAFCMHVPLWPIAAATVFALADCPAFLLRQASRVLRGSIRRGNCVCSRSAWQKGREACRRCQRVAGSRDEALLATLPVFAGD